MARATRRRTSAETAGPAVLPSLALLVQGAIGLLVGVIFLQRAGEAPMQSLAGFAGTLGLVFSIPGIAAFTAGVGLWREKPWSRRLGLIMGVIGVVVAALLALAGTLSANPAALLFALLIGGVNYAVVRSLRNR